MREGAHETEPIDKCRTIHREGMNQVGEILPLHGADVLQSGDGVISNFESLFLDACEPAREAREIERRLLPSVHQNHRTRCRELGAATLWQNRDRRAEYRGCSHLPFERRGNQCAAASRHRFSTDRIILLSPSAFTIGHAIPKFARSRSLDSCRKELSEQSFDSHTLPQGGSPDRRCSCGWKVTVIDGSQLNPCATFISGETTTSVLKGFTLTNGVGAGAPYYTDGGGVAISNSSPTITQNQIINNASSSGGGISSSFGSPAITDNVISKNKASYGGGVYIGGATVASFPPIISSNTIEDNVAYPYYAGAGLALFAAGTVIVENNKITRNQVQYGQGGGVWVVNEADAKFIQNLITGNSAGAGGGVYLSVPISSEGLLFVNNTIAANDSADASGVWVGGFDSNDQFFDNLIIGSAGEIAFHCDTLYSSTPPVVQFNDAWASNGTGFDGSCASDSGFNGNISGNPLFCRRRTFVYLEDRLQLIQGTMQHLTCRAQIWQAISESLMEMCFLRQSLTWVHMSSSRSPCCRGL